MGSIQFTCGDVLVAIVTGVLVDGTFAYTIGDGATGGFEIGFILAVTIPSC
jgi:hypothetical protein